MMVSVGLLLLFLAPVQSQPQVADVGGFQPDEILSPPGGPEIVVFRSIMPEVVSLRLSVPFLESRAQAGVGQLIQIPAQERMQELAQRIGARAEVQRTPQAIVYQVSGAITDLDFLGWILRAGLEAPSSQEVERALRVVRSETDRFLDTPQGVLSVRIRERLSASAPSIHGLPGALDRVDASRLRTLWTDTHRRDQMRLVVAGRVPSEVLLAMAVELGLTGPPSATEFALPEGAGVPQPAPEVIRHWRVDAYPLGDSEPARALVGARWLAEVLRNEGGEFEVGVEIWDLGGERALILSAAAYPQARQLMESRLQGAMERAATQLSEGSIQRLADGLRTDILMESRTPWGLVSLVGQAWDAGYGPEGVESLLRDLDQLSETTVQQFLQSLADTAPIREEIAP